MKKDGKIHRQTQTDKYKVHCYTLSMLTEESNAFRIRLASSLQWVYRALQSQFFNCVHYSINDFFHVSIFFIFIAPMGFHFFSFHFSLHQCALRFNLLLFSFLFWLIHICFFPFSFNYPSFLLFHIALQLHFTATLTSFLQLHYPMLSNTYTG